MEKLPEKVGSGDLECWMQLVKDWRTCESPTEAPGYTTLSFV